MDLNPGGLISWIVVGVIAGWLATKLVDSRGGGCIFNLVIGVIGAFIGGLIMTAIGFDGTTGFIGTLAVATLGAVILLTIARIAR